MKIIVVSDDHLRMRTFLLSGRKLAFELGILVLFAVCVGGGSVYFWLTLGKEQMLTAEGLKDWKQVLDSQQQELSLVRQQAEQQLDAIVLRVAQLQGRVTRLDALGERLTAKGSMDDGEFDFNEEPAVGGPHVTGEKAGTEQRSSILQSIDRLADQIDSREQQLDLLDRLLAMRKFHDEAFLSGKPVRKGWLSSSFGQRTDPFTGRAAWHNGVDFAGKHGSEILSVAAGVVVWSGQKTGYGLLVEIDHANGYVTRYAHSDVNLVKVGDIVARGQVIAKMGSSGRSTGPHVHYEVLKDGEPQDPERYINRKEM